MTLDELFDTTTPPISLALVIQRLEEMTQALGALRHQISRLEERHVVHEQWIGSTLDDLRRGSPIRFRDSEEYSRYMRDEQMRKYSYGYDYTLPVRPLKITNPTS